MDVLARSQVAIDPDRRAGTRVDVIIAARTVIIIALTVVTRVIRVVSVIPVVSITVCVAGVAIAAICTRRPAIPIVIAGVAVIARTAGTWTWRRICGACRHAERA